MFNPLLRNIMAKTTAIIPVWKVQEFATPVSQQECIRVIKHMLSMEEALSLIPSSKKKKISRGF
jgi:chorismate mutase